MRVFLRVDVVATNKSGLDVVNSGEKQQSAAAAAAAASAAATSGSSSISSMSSSTTSTSSSSSIGSSTSKSTTAAAAHTAVAGWPRQSVTQHVRINASNQTKNELREPYLKKQPVPSDAVVGAVLLSLLARIAS